MVNNSFIDVLGKNGNKPLDFVVFKISNVFLIAFDSIWDDK